MLLLKNAWPFLRNTHTPILKLLSIGNFARAFNYSGRLHHKDVEIANFSSLSFQDLIVNFVKDSYRQSLVFVSYFFFLFRQIQNIVTDVCVRSSFKFNAAHSTL